MDDLDKFMIGKVLDGSWKVIEPRYIERDTSSTNRMYLARNDNGRPAFVKVYDPRGQGSLQQQELHLQLFRYEKEILDKCGERHLHRVVRALTSGELHAEGILVVTVRYLVFEWADSDVRSQTDLEQRAHLAASLRWLHHMATALQELHFLQIAHQDIRPATVLVMPDQTAKLGQLGRAHDHTYPRPGGDAEPDPTNAPPEVLYGQAFRSHEDRRAGDLYALGSLAVYLFTGVGLNSQMARHMPPIHHWSEWRGSYGDMLDHIRTYYDLTIDDFESQIDILVRNDLVATVRWLSDPNPKLRGYPANRQGGSQYHMERFVSRFNVLASTAEWQRSRPKNDEPD